VRLDEVVLHAMEKEPSIVTASHEVKNAGGKHCHTSARAAPAVSAGKFWPGIIFEHSPLPASCWAWCEMIFGRSSACPDS